MQTVCRNGVLMNSAVRNIRFDWLPGRKELMVLYENSTNFCVTHTYQIIMDTDELWFVYENAHNGFTPCVATSIRVALFLLGQF